MIGRSKYMLAFREEVEGENFLGDISKQSMSHIAVK
jgi:hypothetical protein